MVPVFVLSTHVTGLAIIRSLGLMNVPIIAIYYENRDMGYVSKFVQEKLFVPHPEQNEDQFIELLLKCSKKFGRCLLIPADDTTLLAVSKHKEMLEEYFITAFTNEKITKQFIDKKLTYELAESIGIPAPDTLNLDSVRDINKYKNKLNYPCLLKPRQSHKYFEMFGIKLAVGDNLEQILHYYEHHRLQFYMKQKMIGNLN